MFDEAFRLVLRAEDDLMGGGLPLVRQSSALTLARFLARSK